MIDELKPPVKKGFGEEKNNNKKILIVEDDEDFLSILKTKFTSEGFSVATAKDGNEGISVAGRENPDLILSDVLIPRMNGIEMVKKIRESGNNVLVIFLTNIKDDDYTKDIISVGADYLIKSDLRINDIVAKVKTKLNIKNED